MKKALALFIWFMLLMVVWTIGNQCISAPNDITMTIGFVIWAVFIWLSYKTRFLTTIKFWDK